MQKKIQTKQEMKTLLEVSARCDGLGKVSQTISALQRCEARQHVKV